MSDTNLEQNTTLSRRSFIVGSAAIAGGGLALGLNVPFEEAQAQTAQAATEVNLWVAIKPDDTCVIRIARSEMGQGTITGLAQLVAEELECDWSKVKGEFAPPHENRRRNRVWGNMSTGASRSVSTSQADLRQAGAVARTMLIAAAAARWNVSTFECGAANSVITHHPSGRTVTFGNIAAAASEVAPPTQVKLKDPPAWKLIGTRQRRLEVPDKVAGKPIYAIDVRLPNMLYAAIAQCPVFKGTLKSVDESALARMKGVRRLIKQPDAVAVIAESWWQAKQALEALPVSWDFGEAADVSSGSIRDALRAGLSANDARVGRSEGDDAAALAAAARRVEADYEVPFLAHATMEPQNCTAHVTADAVEIWAPTQDGETALAIAAVSPRVMQFGVDRNFLQGLLEDMPYAVPNYAVDFAMRNTRVPVGVWRSVNHSQNAFFKESFVDEMAHAARVDPYLFRRRLLAKKPKELAVLEAAATRAGWGSPAAARVFRGIALHNSQNSTCAQVVEASVDRAGKLRVHRVVSAIDVGHVVNPLTIELQTESAIVFALTAALYGEISIKEGRVEQSNFHDYPMLRMADVPRVETVILASGDFWGGVGETPVPPLAPALCNAIFAATGKRIRSLPIKKHDLRSA